MKGAAESLSSSVPKIISGGASDSQTDDDLISIAPEFLFILQQKLDRKERRCIVGENIFEGL